MNRRCNKLDDQIGKRVKITFTDGDVREGVLDWQGRYNPDNGLKPFSYNLLLPAGNHVCFKKSNVKTVERV